jgi:ribonuclease D
MDHDWVWVDNEQQIERVRDETQNSSFIGVDTEYDSFRYFREKLCLIQLVSGSKTYVIDPLEDLDISFLGDLFSNSETTKILHAGDNDIRILNRDYGFVFKNIFDTSRAASILGCNYLSLSNVVTHYLGVALHKSKKMQRSQWEQRPLTEEQLHYAVKDTKYLSELYRILNYMLQKEDLDQRAGEAFRTMEDIRWREKRLDPLGYLKIKGCQELNVQQEERLKSLYCWRFEKARETNKARFMILSDQNLFDLSIEKIDTITSLTERGKLSPRKIRNFGSEIIETLNNVDLK